jgi:hypothetical protein
VVTQKELNDCVCEQAQEYLRMTYEELRTVADRELVGPDRLSRWQLCGTEDTYLAVSVARLGWLWKRVGVELLLSAGDDRSRLTAIVYFERCRSGKLRGPWWPRP